MKMIAIHSIEGRASDPKTVAPGTIFNATKDEQTDLIALRAARPATDDEVKLFDARNGRETGAVETPAVNRDALEARAKELEITFNKNISDDGLAKRIGEAEKKAAEGGETLV